MADSDKAPAITEKPLLLYHWLCPYVHRVSLSLAHKKLAEPIQEVAVDLKAKPSWILQLSPFSKVPAVAYKTGDKVHTLYESLVLMDWVNEFYPGPALLPADPGDRALARIIISRADSNVVSTFYKLLMGTDVAAAKPLLESLHKELSWLESVMHPTGPFLLGAEASLADAAVAPWLMRSNVLQHWRKVDMLEGHPKLQAWLAHYTSLPEVLATKRPPSTATSWEEQMAEGYTSYAKGVIDLPAAIAAL